MNTQQTALQIVECPRDAMQGWRSFIATEDKINYINSLLKVGFHTIDFGSFVSPKAIPQMADTKEVLAGLKLNETKTKLLAIVANTRGAEEAIAFNEISYLGFPYSISPTFQHRNTNSSPEESFQRVKEIRKLCSASGKELVVYLSMGFGNPYGDAYDEEILLRNAEMLVNEGISIISLADTIGIATASQVRFALNTLIPKYKDVTFGAHLHSTASNWREKLSAAVDAGCTRIDGALKGIGGCPMAQDDLVGNMNTEWIISYLEEKKMLDGIDHSELENSLHLAEKIFQ